MHRRLSSRYLDSIIGLLQDPFVVLCEPIHLGYRQFDELPRSKLRGISPAEFIALIEASLEEFDPKRLKVLEYTTIIVSEIDLSTSLNQPIRNM